MPRGDGTGPEGQGAATGRGAGYCVGTDAPGYASDFGGGQRRRAMGGAQGRRGGYGRGNYRQAAGGPGWFGMLVELLGAGRADAEPGQQPPRTSAVGFQAQIDDLKQRLDDKQGSGD